MRRKFCVAKPGSFLVVMRNGSENGRHRFLMIGIDAMSLPFVEANRDRLPVFSGLLQEGTLRALSTPGEHASASVWQTFAAGADPGVHGQYYPLQWDPRRMIFERPARGEFGARLSFDPFWRRLAREGVETIAFDISLPLNAGAAPCTEIFNWSCQSSGAARASDPALLRELRRRFGARPIGKEVPLPKRAAHTRRIRDQMIDAIARKAEAMLWMMDRSPWRLFVTGFYEIHRAGHNLLEVDGDFASEVDPEALFDVYKAQDAALGRVIDAAKDGRTTIAVFALHGMASNAAQDHFVDKILARLNSVWLVETGRSSQKSSASPNLMKRMRQLAPYRLQHALAHLLGEDVQDWVVGQTLIAGKDWRRTPSFPVATSGEGLIRLNIKGRERDGFFDADGQELERYKTWLKARLLEIRVAGDGGPLVREVVFAEDRFPGPRCAYLPDVMLIFAPSAPAETITSPAIGEISARLRTGRGGNHTGQAFCLLTGHGARDGIAAKISDIKDLAALAAAMTSAEQGCAPDKAAVVEFA